MKTLRYLAIAAFALLAFASCGKYETVKGDPLDAKIYTLDNGLKVYMTVNKEQPKIQTIIAVKVGSKNDPSETTGLAHYFEHLMFKGTQQFGTSDYEAEKPMLDQIEQLFEQYRATADEAERAAIYHRIDSISYEASKIAIPNEYDKLMAMIGSDGTNAWTSSDETCYFEEIPSNQIDNWARIQADRFRNIVIRGFHTELETIYEEKNMSLTQDSRKVWESLSASLYPHHPYGKQTTLGTQEHLKNPSITNVKKYHDDYYVPNNIAICVSGDFNPDEMVAAIEKYFGDWQPNPSVPVLEYEAEEPITSPIQKDVYGLEAESVVLAWRIPGASDTKTAAIANIAGAVLSNGKAGLVDLNVNQQQKVMSMSAGASIDADYGQFTFSGRPKQGQTLEEVRDIALEQAELLRKGEFDESLIESTRNRLKLSQEEELESNWNRAYSFASSFINSLSWKEACKELDRLNAVTKEDVVAFANEYLAPEAYAVVYKRQGVDTTVSKISAPSITPIESNRNAQSAFLAEIQGVEVKPIEPVFVDFEKDMKTAELAKGVELLYCKKDINDIFGLSFKYNVGLEDCPMLSLASDYMTYLGTATMTAEEFAAKMYSLACDFYVMPGNRQTEIYLTGLSENMEQAYNLVKELIMNAEGNDEILASVKSDLFKSRVDTKTRQRSCYNALTRYITYGPEVIAATTPSNEAIAQVSSDELLSDVRNLFSKGCEVMYYGPMGIEEVSSTLAFAGEFVTREDSFDPTLETPENSVVMAPYDAKQIYYLQYSNRGEKYDVSQTAPITLYNEYFGGGMNSIVFQEMREARGLAYSANARLSTPGFADGCYTFQAFIATQNDKMQTAVEAFDEIINQMPRSEAAFNVAKDGLVNRLRTERKKGMNILNAYVSCRHRNLSELPDREVFEKVQNMTLDDVVSAQEQWVKDRKYTFGILGDVKDLDTDFLKTLGPVKLVSLEEIFGF